MSMSRLGSSAARRLGAPPRIGISKSRGSTKKGLLASGDTELLALSILPNVSLSIEASWSSDSAAGSYYINGPRQNLEILSRLVGGDTKQLRGVLSPCSAVTLPREHRKAAGIPFEATAYCYIHQVEHLRDELEALKLSRDPWAFVLLAGGFAYFGEGGKLLQVNAIAYAPSPTGLVLVGRPVTSSSASAAASLLKKHGRLVPITDPMIVRAGFEAFGWVHADETFAGEQISSEHPYPHGAFLYRRRPGATGQGTARHRFDDAPTASIGASPMADEEAHAEAHDTSSSAEPSAAQGGTSVEAFAIDDEHPLEVLSLDDDAESPDGGGQGDGGGGGDTGARVAGQEAPGHTGGQLFLYALEPVTAKVYREISAEDAGGANANVGANVGANAGAGGLAAAMVDVRAKSVAAQRVVTEAAKVARLEMRGSQRKPLLRRMQLHALRVLVMVMYLALGTLFYSYAERSAGWGSTEALYFSVVTISTVGYGDLSPSNRASQLFTAIYILVGVGMIFGLAGDLYKAAAKSLEEGVTLLLSRLRWLLRRGRASVEDLLEDVTGADLGGDGGAGDAGNLVPAWQFYLTKLLPTVLVGLAYNLFFSAYIFTLTQEGLSYSTALWHCWVTCTTVGFGDVALTTPASR